MEINVKVDDALVRANLGKLSDKMAKAMEEGLTETIVTIANTVIHEHPWQRRTGNNSNSIAYNVNGKGHRQGSPAPGKSFSPLEPPTPRLTGMVYSTSGYGGYLETGTFKMSAYPYFKPAVDRHLPNLGKYIKERL